MARAFCLAHFWRAEYGQPEINIGVDAKGKEAKGHVWISVNGRTISRIDERASGHYSVLMADLGQIRYWYAGRLGEPLNVIE